ncbi:MAG: phosphoglycerate kinase [Deferribacteraceae bacterium]|jgi:phosphoglycerate kinase|nr:phosphoglycerate kinase [Deferribacteraceae bacterium]
MLKTLKDIDLKGKKVFVRVDFNVPVKDGVVTDDTRIREALKTIKYVTDNGGFATLATHLGRPKGEKNPKYTVKPVADHINGKGYFKAVFVDDCIGKSVTEAVNNQKQDTVLILENLRFYPDEEKNNPEFSKNLAAPFDVYINDAFGTSHRKHASVYGIPSVMQNKAAGFLLEKEALYFDRLLQAPEHPFSAVLGGAKVSDKIGVIESLLERADNILIGGAMAYTFLKYKGIGVGKSLVEEELLGTVEKVLKKAADKGVEIALPVDHIVSAEFGGAPEVCGVQDIPADRMGLDIGPKTIESYKKMLSKSKTILWNGPMGVFEQPAYAEGTFAIAKYAAELDATVVVGGGDSVAAVNQAGVSDKISHISTGGGASLEYLEYGSLPGIDILRG